MTLITSAEQDVIGKLIVEVEDAISQIGKVIGTGHPAVKSLKDARGFLTGLRDGGYWCAPGRQQPGPASTRTGDLSDDRE